MGDVRATPAAAEVRLERRGSLAIVTLDRPQALNALSLDMQARLAQAIAGFGRDPGLYGVLLRSAVPGAFSVGGDVREITALAEHDLAAARKALAAELRLCWVLECLSKPSLSLVNGRIMGAGVGISLYNTHRVAGEEYSFSMPETQLGYFPDCGVARALGRMPDGIGLYLGLTGRSIGRADALALGLVTHCIPSARFAEIEAQLVDAEPIDPVLDDRHQEPGPSPLLAERAVIASFFGAASLGEILARLRAATGEARRFAEATLATLAGHSPTALAVTDRMIRAAAHMEIEAALAQDYRLAHRFIAGGDFREGVRALLVARDGPPRWSPDRIEEVTPAMLDELFAPLGPDELRLATRAEMQAARV